MRLGHIKLNLQANQSPASRRDPTSNKLNETEKGKTNVFEVICWAHYIKDTIFDYI